MLTFGSQAPVIKILKYLSLTIISNNSEVTNFLRELLSQIINRYKHTKDKSVLDHPEFIPIIRDIIVNIKFYHKLKIEQVSIDSEAENNLSQNFGIIVHISIEACVLTMGRSRCDINNNTDKETNEIIFTRAFDFYKYLFDALIKLIMNYKRIPSADFRRVKNYVNITSAFKEPTFELCYKDAKFLLLKFLSILFFGKLCLNILVLLLFQYFNILIYIWESYQSKQFEFRHGHI